MFRNKPALAILLLLAGTLRAQVGGAIVNTSGGTVTSVATSNCLTGGTFTTSGTISFNGAINPKTSTYQVLASDFSGCKTITVASGTFTITLVASGSQPAAGQFINIVNYGSGVVTVARSGQNINDGTASLTLGAGSATAPTSVQVFSDGTNYFATVDSAGSGAGTVTSVATTSPIGGGTITGSGTITCTTCITGSSMTSGQLATGNTGQAVTVGNLSGDVTTSGSTATTVVKVNGASVPASAALVGTNSSNQIILASPYDVNPQTATYQVLAADFSNYKTITVASGTFTITLVASGSQPANGQYISIVNYGSGVVTIARSGQNINGGTGSLTLAAASATAPTAAQIWSDGTNYFSDLTNNNAGTVTSVATTAPLGGGTITGTGTLTCSTCATTTNGGALSGTAPIAVSAAGVISGGGLGSVTGALKGNGSGTITQAACADLSNGSGVFCSASGATNAQTGTYQVLAGDFSNLKPITVASGTFTITLVASGSQPAAGQFINIINYGSGVVTVARSGQNINGGTTSLTLNAGTATAPTSAYVVSDGTNYFANVTEGTVGTVTSVATTSPLTGGTITGSGTVACATCTTSASSLTVHGPLVGAAGQAMVATAAGTAHQNFQSGGASADGAYADDRDVKIIPFAAAPGGTASAGVSYATGQWTPTARAGTNNLGGSLQAIPSTGATLQFRLEIPADWDSSNQAFIRIEYGSGANTSGTVIWTVSSACTKTDGSVTDDPAFNAESAFGSQTMAAVSRAWSKTGQFTAITSGNNCVAGGGIIIKAVLSGTAGSAINAYQAVVSIPVQPNAGQAQ